MERSIPPPKRAAGASTAAIAGSISALIGLVTALITLAGTLDNDPPKADPPQPSPISTTELGVTRADWAAAANQICVEVGNQINSTTFSGDFALALTTWENGVRRLETEVGRLDAPAEDAGTIGRLVTLWAEVRQDYLDALAAFNVGDTFNAQELVRRADSTTLQVNTIAETLGASDCLMATSGL